MPRCRTVAIIWLPRRVRPPLTAQPAGATVTSQSAIAIDTTVDAGSTSGTGTLVVISPTGTTAATPVLVS
jgi:hypothetical protein